MAVPTNNIPLWLSAAIAFTGKGRGGGYAGKARRSRPFPLQTRVPCPPRPRQQATSPFPGPGARSRGLGRAPAPSALPQPRGRPSCLWQGRDAAGVSEGILFFKLLYLLLIFFFLFPTLSLTGLLSKRLTPSFQRQLAAVGKRSRAEKGSYFWLCGASDFCFEEEFKV